MVGDGVQPNTKTFTALIGAFGKMGSTGAAMEVVTQLLDAGSGAPSLQATYGALMAACEKAGQWDLALAMFDRLSAQACNLSLEAH